MTRKFTAFALALAFLAGAAAVTPVAYAQGAARAVRADFRTERPAPDVRHIADWAVHSGDHHRMPFIVVDKANARIYAFDSTGRLIRSSAILLGTGVGDTFPPGVLEMDMYDTKPWQRITPAGRYHATEDYNLAGERVLWVDYDAGIAIHKVPAKKTPQRRHERLRSADPAEHRITYGCINVWPSFYDQVVRTHFKGRGGIVYVLPEQAPVKSVFRSYDVDASPRIQSTAADVPKASTRRF